MNRHIFTGIILGALLAGSPAWAHHSFPATYKVDQEQTIQGTVVAFLYRNPHASIQVQAPDENGDMVRYMIEWAGGAALAREGITRATLKPGDQVTIVGNPGRNEADHRMRLRKITRPSDGWSWGGDFN